MLNVLVCEGEKCSSHLFQVLHSEACKNSNKTSTVTTLFFPFLVYI